MTEQNVEMKIDPTRAKHLVSNLQHISERVAKVSKGRNVSSQAYEVNGACVPVERGGLRLKGTNAVT